MADDNQDEPRPFDVRTVEYLLKLMTQHDLAEVDLKEGDQRIRLRKGSALVAYASVPTNPPPVAYAPSAPPPVAPPVAHAPGSPPPAPAPAKNLIEIKSPMVGSFYSKPKPDKPDYVTKGAKVTPKTVVCQVEAMKLFNEITADCSGTVVEVCVENGAGVEFNQVLFRVEPS